MNTRRSLHCVVISHAWALYALEREGFLKGPNPIIIELARLSNLAAMFGEQARMHSGLAGLLNPKARLDTLSQRYEGIAAPLILSPRPSVPVPTLTAALGLVGSTPSGFGDAVIVLHISDVLELTQALPMMDRISFFWDIGDEPTALLPKVANTLAEMDLLRADRWGGFHWYQHSERPAKDFEARRASLRGLTERYPDHIHSLL